MIRMIKRYLPKFSGVAEEGIFLVIWRQLLGGTDEIDDEHISVGLLKGIRTKMPH